MAQFEKVSTSSFKMRIIIVWKLNPSASYCWSNYFDENCVKCTGPPVVIGFYDKLIVYL